MGVGVLLVTHEAMGAALVGAARHVLGRLPLPVDVVEVAASADPDNTLRDAATHARSLDEGAGVLVNVDQVTTIRADGHAGTLVVAGGELLHVAEEYSTVRQNPPSTARLSSSVSGVGRASGWMKASRCTSARRPSSRTMLKPRCSTPPCGG